MKKTPFALIASVGLALMVLAGCNTFRGMGQDVQRAGSALENAAKK
jgi:entericidin A